MTRKNFKKRGKAPIKAKERFEFGEIDLGDDDFELTGSDLDFATNVYGDDLLIIDFDKFELETFNKGDFNFDITEPALPSGKTKKQDAKKGKSAGKGSKKSSNKKDSKTPNSGIKNDKRSSIKKKDAQNGNLDASYHGDDDYSNVESPNRRDKKHHHSPTNQKSCNPSPKVNLMKNRFNRFVKAQDPISHLPNFEFVQESVTIEVTSNSTKDAKHHESEIDIVIEESFSNNQSDGTDIEIEFEVPIDFKEKNASMHPFNEMNLNFRILDSVFTHDSDEDSEDFFESFEESVNDDSYEDHMNDDYYEDHMDDDSYEDNLLYASYEEKILIDSSDHSIDDDFDKMSTESFEPHRSSYYEDMCDDEDDLVFERNVMRLDKEFYYNLDNLVDRDYSSDTDVEDEETFLEQLRGSYDRSIFMQKYNAYLKKHPEESEEPKVKSKPPQKERLSKKKRKAMKSKERKLMPLDYYELCKWNTILRNLVKSRSLEKIRPWTSMNKTQRRQVQLLASFYGMKTKSSSKMLISVVSTSESKLVDLEESKAYIKEHLCNKNIRDMNYTPPKRNVNNTTPTRPSNSRRSLQGRYVGDNAKPLTPEACKGFVMLQKIGWQGGGLGANEQGTENILLARIKNDKSGLGY